MEEAWYLRRAKHRTLASFDDSPVTAR
jgi:hypothetical protein